MDSRFTRAGNTSHTGEHVDMSKEQVVYGTAGFRMKAERLPYIMYRMAVLARLRSQALGGQAIGLMITASHNPECDNGVKVVDPMGEMLAKEWETIATEMANVDDADLATFIASIKLNFSVKDDTVPTVIVGHDTRDSCSHLLTAVKSGFSHVTAGESVDWEIENLGLVTTPQLHYVVRCSNDRTYGMPFVSNYRNKLMTAFRALNEIFSSAPTTLTVDCANGVGAVAIKDLPNVVAVNTGEGQLNHECGADYVKLHARLPSGMNVAGGSRCASFDGDADRIVYYFVDESGQFNLLDGDAIAVLLAMFINEQLKPIEKHFDAKSIKMGIVQTAYANGASTKFVKETLGVTVACTPTGVKHLHHAALEFDIGVYFEANGHGTIVYSQTLKDTTLNVIGMKESLTPEERQCVRVLGHFIDLTNETVGDALSDMLLVETVLRAKNMTVVDWSNVYTDLPNKQSKVAVTDRTLIKTTWDETRCTSPDGLQSAIDAVLGAVPKESQVRAFVRPSGTEDVVRVYVEAKKETIVQRVTDKIVAEVKKYCNK